MNQQYVLVAVINSMKAYKQVKKKLPEIGYERFTVMDSMGATECVDNMEYSQLFAKSISESDSKKYNKTVILVVPNEEEVIRVMDELEKLLHMDPKQPGKGIMFTFPIVSSAGVRFNENLGE